MGSARQCQKRAFPRAANIIFPHRPFSDRWLDESIQRFYCRIHMYSWERHCTGRKKHAYTHNKRFLLLHFAPSSSTAVPAEGYKKYASLCRTHTHSYTGHSERRPSVYRQTIPIFSSSSCMGGRRRAKKKRIKERRVIVSRIGGGGGLFDLHALFPHFIAREAFVFLFLLFSALDAALL